VENGQKVRYFKSTGNVIGWGDYYGKIKRYIQ
jgi:hypothetical protein